MQSKQQIHSLTAFRGFAAIIVVIYHYSGGFLPAIDSSHGTDFITQGYLWVDFFFLLSGFVLAHAYGQTFASGLRGAEMRSFITARFARIYPLHLVILMAYVGLELVKLAAARGGVSFYQTPFTGDKTLEGLAANLTLTQTTGLMDRLSWNGPAWSVGAEWLSYLLFPLMVLALARAVPFARLLAIIGVFAGLFWVSGGGSDLDVTDGFGFWRCAFGVVAGILLHRCVHLARTLGFGRDVMALAMIAAVVMALHEGINDLFVPPLFALLILALATNEGRVGKVLSGPTFVWLGTISYAIYLVHMLVMEAVRLAARILLDRNFGNIFDPVQSVLVLVVLTAVVVVLANWLHQRVEEPARRLIRRWGEPRAAARQTAG